MTAVDITSLREWLASWGDGPNRIDSTGETVAISKLTLVSLLDEIDRLRAVASEPAAISS